MKIPSDFHLLRLKQSIYLTFISSKYAFTTEFMSLLYSLYRVLSGLACKYLHQWPDSAAVIRLTAAFTTLRL